ncbi:cystathionine beta-synthase [Orbilia oligospora]|nr:cystathionine beta-synthase [Orbilia oligospora]
MTLVSVTAGNTVVVVLNELVLVTVETIVVVVIIGKSIELAKLTTNGRYGHLRASFLNVTGGGAPVSKLMVAKIYKKIDRPGLLKKTQLNMPQLPLSPPLTSALDLIGNTPMVQLGSLPRSLGIRAQVFAKLEYYNAGGSVKDRVGLAMVTAAEKEGRLKPGDTIIEATSGNT